MNRKALLRFSRIVVSALLFAGLAAHADIAITLKNSFIEQYKNSATITTAYVIDKAHARPNPASKDGDLHIAGRAREVGLPIVAEIMNAAAEPQAVDAVHAAEGTGKPIRLTGAWRIWTEHGGDTIQKQGMALRPFDTSNPDHVFEIHPVTQLNGLSLLGSFHPIEGFVTKDAERAFHRYENTRFEITPKGATTQLVTTMAGYNYVEFLIELNNDPYTVPGGRMAMASVEDLDGELLVRNRRMVFVDGTPPEAAVRDLKKGSCLHVLGIPRINLSLVSWRTHHVKDRPDALKWSLPYEMIVAGVYHDDACSKR